MKYDKNNIFAKILRKEIPCKKVFENEFVLAFHDINPAAPKHVLVIPKGSYVTYDHFAQTAPDDEITDFVRAIGVVCKILNVEPGQGGGGFRAISNAGEAGLQEVPHLHVHILGGRNLGPMLSKSQ